MPTNIDFNEYALTEPTGGWQILLSPKQFTAGCILLMPTKQAAAYADLAHDVAAQLPELIGRVQHTVQRVLSPEHTVTLIDTTHFDGCHVLIVPRFSKERLYAGMQFTDPGWPRLPELTHTHPIDAARREGLIQGLRAAWEASA